MYSKAFSLLKEDHEEKEEEYEWWHNCVLCLSVRAGESPSALHSTIPLGRVFRATNVLSPLTFSVIGAERRESKQGHPSNHAPMMVMCSECHFIWGTWLDGLDS